MMKYWIIVASRDHALRGVSEGFCQACHGKKAPLQKMSSGDWVIIYSPRQEFETDEKCQKFTAIGQVKEDEIYQVEMYSGFVPFRRKIGWISCNEVSIQPLLLFLSFTAGLKQWGLPFRRGFFEINKTDFELIRKGMVSERDAFVAD